MSLTSLLDVDFLAVGRVMVDGNVFNVEAVLWQSGILGLALAGQI
jgi:hypothetical protein